MRQTPCVRRFLAAMIGGGTWWSDHAQHESAGVRQPVRRRGGRMAAGSGSAAGSEPTIGFLGTATPVAWRPWAAAFLQRPLCALNELNDRTAIPKLFSI